jgi:hypothetical protein
VPLRVVHSTVLAAMLTVLVAGCGGGGEQQAVRDTLARLQQATARHDYATLCNRVFTARLVETLTQRGLPCERALSIGLGNVRQPRLEIQRVSVKGNQAQATVRSTATGELPATDLVQLVKQPDGWRVAQLAPVQQPAPKR